MIGSSSFMTPGEMDTDDLKDLSKSINADIVLIGSELVNSQQQPMMVPTWQPGQTSTTTYNGNVGSTPMSGYATTQSYGGVGAQNVPVTVNTYKYTAAFWRKLKQ